MGGPQGPLNDLDLSPLGEEYEVWDHYDYY